MTLYTHLYLTPQTILMLEQVNNIQVGLYICPFRQLVYNEAWRHGAFFKYSGNAKTKVLSKDTAPFT